jgi:hypothetical protein
MNSGLEIGFTLARVEFRFQIRWHRFARIAIQKYEVAAAPFLPEIRRTLLRRLKSRVRAEPPAPELGSHSCPLRTQGWRRSQMRMDGRPGV